MPIEESYYTFFAHTLTRGSFADNQREKSAKIASETLEVVFKFVVLVGLTFLVFGYSYSFLLLDIYGGSTLSSGEGNSQHFLFVFSFFFLSFFFLFISLSRLSLW